MIFLATFVDGLLHGPSLTFGATQPVHGDPPTVVSAAHVIQRSAF
ncbi:hypothetical protein [Saccharopolyspora soli]|nr:hypothetical protein [Saccharopolyspora soli]